VLEIQQSSQKNLEVQRSILAEEVRRGLSLETDLLEADIAIVQARLEVRSLEMDVAEAESQLVRFVRFGDASPPFAAH